MSFLFFMFFEARIADIILLKARIADYIVLYKIIFSRSA